MGPWQVGLIVLLATAVAFAVSGDSRAIYAGFVIGGVMVAAHFVVRRAVGRAPKVQDDASPVERARVTRPYLLRQAVVVGVVTAAAFAYAFATGGPSALGAVYLSLPLVGVLAVLLVVSRRARG